jgi:alpha-tubulin suppressor-like RCC1 family protein
MTANQKNSNFSQIASTDVNGNVTGISVASPTNISVGGDTGGRFLQSNGAGALQWGAPSLSYGTIKKMTTTGTNGMLTLMEDGRLYLTRAENSVHWCAIETAGSSFNPNSWYGVEATHLIQLPLTESGKIIDAGIMGGQAAYALCDNGNLYTWGRNDVGQLGHGNTTNTRIPTLAATDVVEVYSCDSPVRNVSLVRLFIKKTDGKIYGCGYGGQGGLGIGSTTNQSLFVEIPLAGVNPRKVFNLGTFLGCLVVQRADGSIWVAGYNAYGQLGNGTTTNITTLTAMPAWNNNDPTLNLEYAYCGAGYTDTADANNTFLFMWFKGSTIDVIKVAGNNAWGSIGNGSTTGNNVTTPFTTPVPGTARIDKVFVSGGGPGTCRVLRVDGTLYGWGYNGHGGLGVGTTINVLSPTLIQSNVTDLLDTGDCFAWSFREVTMIRKSDGFYYATGRNEESQLGIGIDVSNVSTFTRMAYPRGTVIKHLGQYNAQNAVRSYFAVDQDGRWFGHGFSNLYAISNQNWVNTRHKVDTPMRVTPFNIILDKFI